MKLRNTLALIAVAVLLGLYVWKYEQGEIPDETADRAVLALAGFKNAEDVVEITVNRGQGPLTLQRIPRTEEQKTAARDLGQGEGEDDWKLLAPLDSAADKNTANAFVRSVLTAKATAHYDAEKAKQMSAEDLGFGTSVTSLVLRNTAGEERKITFGNPTINDDSMWSQVQGSEDLYLFSRMFVDDTLAQQKVGDLRDKTLLAVGANEVRTVKLDYPAGGLELERGEADRWQLKLADRTLPADRDAVDNLLASLVGARIDEFVAEKTDSPASFGLDKPRVTITLGAGAKGELGLSLGSSTFETEAAPDPMNQGQPPQPTEKVYVQRKGDTEVLQVAGSLYGALVKTPEDFRDKTILAVDPLAVTKVAYSLGDKSVELVREQAPAAGSTVVDDTSGWKLVKPVELPADPARVGRLLDNLRSLRASSFIDEPGDLAQYGLANPLTKITIEQGETKLPTLLIGKASSEGLGTFMKLSDQPLVYRANAALLGDLEVKPERLRVATVLNLDRTLFRTIELRSKGRDTITLSAKGASDWEYTVGEPGAEKKPETKPADAGRVMGLLTALERVRGDEWVTDAPDADLAKYGLADPDVTVTVTTNDGQTHKLLIGDDPNADSLAAYAKVEGQPLIVRNDDGSWLQRFARSEADLEPLPEMPMGGMPMGMPPM